MVIFYGEVMIARDTYDLVVGSLSHNPARDAEINEI
jgi:hypothetical protein